MDHSYGITAVLMFNRSMPNTTHCSLLPSMNDCIPLKLFLNSDVQSLSGQALIVLTQL